MNDPTAKITIGKDTYELPSSVLGQMVAAATMQFSKGQDTTNHGIYREYYGERIAVCKSVQEFISKNVGK